jgi:hypothetical protein
VRKVLSWKHLGHSSGIIYRGAGVVGLKDANVSAVSSRRFKKITRKNQEMRAGGSQILFPSSLISSACGIRR